MKKTHPSRIAVLILCIMMLVSTLPTAVFAAENQIPIDDVRGEPQAFDNEENENNSGDVDIEEDMDAEEEVSGRVTSDYWTSSDDYNSVVLHKEYNVAPGVAEKTLILNDESGDNQNVCHIMEVDVSNPNVDLLSGYSNMDPDNWATQTTSQQAMAAENKLGVNVVGAINTNLSWESNEPIGMLVINGIVHHQGTAQAYFVLTKDGKAEIRNGSEPLRGNEWQATSTFQILVQNGVNVYTTPDHAIGSRAPRTAIGIKADGSVILFVVDGRQAPYSVGMTGYELAQTMIDLGCVTAVNCDGGGTSTFVSERAGTGELKIQNSPSDGWSFQRQNLLESLTTQYFHLIMTYTHQVVPFSLLQLVLIAPARRLLYLKMSHGD